MTEYCMINEKKFGLIIVQITMLRLLLKYTMRINYF